MASGPSSSSMRAKRAGVGVGVPCFLESAMSALPSSMVELPPACLSPERQRARHRRRNAPSGIANAPRGAAAMP
ncbi:MAG: hypothetical protein IPF73_10235 [Betaproteobacteria bacterium]|nr:hypothetical protein [Betaproteobacteria bacterium]